MAIPFELTKEDELLIYLAQTSGNPETEIKVRTIIEKGVNWDSFLDKASYHGLRPLICVNIKNYPDQVPADILNSLKDYFSINSKKNLLFLREMLKLFKLFKTNNITNIHYKGPIMAIYGYGNISMREFGDIDIYIDKKDFQRVKKVLVNENYETVLKLDSSKEAEYMKSQREYKFKNSDNGIIIEIQWNVAGFSFSFPNESSFPINRDGFKLTSLNNQEVKIFSDEDLILILSLHVAGHLWDRLLWICDIVELIKRSECINWNQIIEKAEYLGIERILYLNLSLSHKLFNLQLPKNVQDEIKKDQKLKILEEQVLKSIFTPDQLNLMDKLILRFKMRKSKLNGLKDIYRILTIPQSDEWSSFDKNCPFGLLYLFNQPKQIIKRLKE